MSMKYGLVRFSKKTGKIDRSMEAGVPSLLKLWALKNTTSTKDTIIFETDTGNIVEYYVGTKNGFPKIADERDEENIEKYCKGFLAEYRRLNNTEGCE